MTQRDGTIRPRHGFSLVELLIAIFILGLGVLGIAALFPAGIAQQQQSADDVTGPIVANNAVALLRTKLRDEDFRYDDYDPFDPTTDFYDFLKRGDTPWQRPAYFSDNVDNLMLGAPYNTTVDVKLGTISVFDGTHPMTSDSEVAHNVLLGYRPQVFITQGERAFPMQSVASITEVNAPRPQYYWDCMFRRFEGRVQVAVFVYRVTASPGDRDRYFVAPNPSDPAVPPLPIALDLTESATQAFCKEGPWDADGINRIDGTDGTYDPLDARQSWQEPRQWILDQNNNIHRVLGNFRDDPGNPQQVELVRPVVPVPAVSPYYTRAAVPQADFDDNLVETNIVSDLWYIPLVDSNGLTLTPVYLLVEEL